MLDKVLLVGAGAEIDFGIPGGNIFLLDTYFTKNDRMLDALKSYYGSHGKNLPQYKRVFHFIAASHVFHQLIKGIRDESPQVLADLMDISIEELYQRELSKDDYKRLFETLIIKASDEGEIQDKSNALFSLPLDSYYGTLESLYSSILTPKKHPDNFWKLINYYWSAYFSIIRPLLLTDAAKTRGLDDSFEYVLNHLDHVTKTVWSMDFVQELILSRENYFGQLRHVADYVITTNYTPFVTALTKDPDDCLFLSGSLAHFESASTLDCFDCRKSSQSTDSVDAPFPFLMTRSPIKPIINSYQLRIYSKTLSVLDNCSHLFVLGYSFCEDDAHIAAMIRDYLSHGSMTYFKYLDSDEPYDPNAFKKDLSQSLRVDVHTLEKKCEIICIDKDNAFHSVRDSLSIGKEYK